MCFSISKIAVFIIIPKGAAYCIHFGELLFLPWSRDSITLVGGGGGSVVQCSLASRTDGPGSIPTSAVVGTGARQKMFRVQNTNHEVPPSSTHPSGVKGWGNLGIVPGFYVDNRR